MRITSIALLEGLGATEAEPYAEAAFIVTLDDGTQLDLRGRNVTTDDDGDFMVYAVSPA